MSKATSKVSRKASPAVVPVEAPTTPAVAHVEQAPAQASAAPKVRYAKKDWAATDVITLVTTANPKSGKSKARYALYKSGMSVSDYATAVVNGGHGNKTLANNDLRWDVARGFITIAAK